MAFYKVVLSASVETEIKALPFPLRRQINHAIVSFKRDPRPRAFQDLGGARARLTLHGCRILYKIEDALAVVRVFAVRARAQ